LSAIEDDALAP